MDMDKATDDELVEAFKQTRQLEYLNKLTERHLDSVYAAIRAMVLDAHAAEDLTQEVFLRVSRSLHRFRGKSQFRTWLYRVQINLVQDYRRKAARHKENCTGKRAGATGRHSGCGTAGYGARGTEHGCQCHAKTLAGFA